MIDLDEKRLQAIADAVCPGLATITVTIVSHPVHEPDKRRGWSHTNKRAPRAACAACASTGEVLDHEGDLAPCEECTGLGVIIGPDPRVEIQRVDIDIGHRCSTQFECYLHVEGVHKGRKDLFRPMTVAEVEAKIRQQVGFAAFDAHRLDEIPIERKHALLDAAHASGWIDPARIAAHRAIVVDNHLVATKTPPDRVPDVYGRTCLGCGGDSAGRELGHVVAATAACTACNGTAFLTSRRWHVAGALISTEITPDELAKELA